MRQCIKSLMLVVVLLTFLLNARCKLIFFFYCWCFAILWHPFMQHKLLIFWHSALFHPQHSSAYLWSRSCQCNGTQYFWMCKGNFYLQLVYMPCFLICFLMLRHYYHTLYYEDCYLLQLLKSIFFFWATVSAFTICSPLLSMLQSCSLPSSHHQCFLTHPTSYCLYLCLSLHDLNSQASSHLLLSLRLSLSLARCSCVEL